MEYAIADSYDNYKIHYFEKKNQAILWAWNKAKSRGKGRGFFTIQKVYKTSIRVEIVGQVRYDFTNLKYPIYYRKYSESRHDHLKTPYLVDYKGNLTAIPKRYQFYIKN